MFDKKFNERLQYWSSFRQQLETDIDPIQTTINLFNRSPIVSIQVDPYDSSTWLTPWELLYENKYCEFSKLLAICYTLQLTERFINDNFEIHIITNNEEFSTYYLLFIQDKVIGYDWSSIMNKHEMPSTLQSHKVYLMPKLY